MPTTNFKHEKRQKDIEKKKKRDQKIQRRQGKKPAQPDTEIQPPDAQKKDDTAGN